jgi:PPOX class probable FMN-dependent enzyme
VISATAAKTKQKRQPSLELLLPLMHSDGVLTEATIMDVVEDLEELREIYGPPADRSVKKQLSRFDKHCRAFIARSPFLVIASSDPSGRCDASPKGDAPGFVQVLDDETLLIPDRLGNNRVDTIGNLLDRPGVGLIFFVPGLNETLRVNGRARVTIDPALLEPLAVNSKVPRSGILVAAEEIYFHCGKALIRSDLWNPEKQLRRSEFPSLGRILADQIGGISVEESERATAESYRTRLY